MADAMGAIGCSQLIRAGLLPISGLHFFNPLGRTLPRESPHFTFKFEPTLNTTSNSFNTNLTRTIRLLSGHCIHAPGIVQWACTFYVTAKQRGEPVGPALATIADGFDLGVVLAERLLNGDITFKVDGDAVVLSLTDQDWSIYAVRQATKQDIPGELVQVDMRLGDMNHLAA